jgi:hypothetical protein
MIKPEVRVIEFQQDSAPQEANISASEAHALMLKYGLGHANNIPQHQYQPVDPNANLTFDETVAMEEQKNRIERQNREAERLREMNKPTPHSFDRNRVQYYNNDYRSLKVLAFGMEVKVVSDMPINKVLRY